MLIQDENILGQLSDMVKTGYFQFDCEHSVMTFHFNTSSGNYNVQKTWTQEEIGCNARVIQFYEEGEEEEESIRIFHHSLEVCRNIVCPK